MKVYRSNRVEVLFDALASVLAEPIADGRGAARDPLEPETIVVHSRAMAVWLTMRLSERFGAWANPAFPFPRRFVQQAFTAALGARTDTMAAWDAERLTWAVLAELARHLKRPEFDPLRRFVEADPRPQGRFELATRIAGVFDQYAVFRPKMVLGWQAGESDDWQAILWRALVQRIGDAHAATLAQDFFAAVAAGRIDRAQLPQQVAVFGVSTLPPFYLEVLHALSQQLPVHVFVLSPSQEYWAEIRSQREALRAARRHPDRVALPLPVADEGNPLLASFGAVGRDFQRVLEADVEYVEPHPSLYVANASRSMLAILQDDVLHLRRRGGAPLQDAAADRLPPATIAPADDSIRIHACHTPMREVEVLRDQLLDLVHERGVAPHEIVVLTPDIETYAPLVEAAFERDPVRDATNTFLPYAIADRTARRESPVLEALLRVLALVGGRATATEVLDLLALDAVRKRFDLGADDYDRIVEWVVDSGIRWGIDAAHRQRHGQPAYAENTWQFGLRRLLLGYALPANDEAGTFFGVLPFDPIEGTDALVLGKLAELCTALFAALDALAAPRSLPAWRDAIAQTLDTLLDADDDAAWEHQQIRAALDTIVADADAAQFTDTIALPTIRACLEQRLDDARPARGLFAGGITFCAFLPMRSVPFRVVCLLGMNDGAFPRAARTLGFDRIAAAPQPGDRSRRGDDRFLFLEALLSARERLVVTHVGRSIQDNAIVPPSVVVSELLDVLAESFGPAAHDHVVVHHPMQPFSPRYFLGGGADHDPRLFSYAHAWEEGARALGRGDGAGVPSFLERPLPAPAPRRELPIDELVRFLGMPATQLLKRRLGIDLSDYSRDRSDREPMELDALETWKAGDLVLRHRLDDVPLHRSLELLRAAGALPLGVPGRCRFEELVAIADPIAAFALAIRGRERRPDRDVDLDVGGVRLVGRLRDRWPGASIIAQFGSIRAKHKLAAWIRHLVTCVVDREGPRITAIIGRAEKTDEPSMCQIHPVADARDHLAALVDLYLRGQCEPLLLFPRSSLAYAEALPKGAAEALVVARRQWADHGNPEGGDPHLRRIFGDTDPLAREEFAALARAVFGPFIAHRKDNG